jgi:hypothetical protein
VYYVWGRGEVYTGFGWENLRGRRPLRRSRRRCEVNVKMDLQEVGRGIDWVDLAQDRDKGRALGNAVMIFWVP